MTDADWSKTTEHETRARTHAVDPAVLEPLPEHPRYRHLGIVGMGGQGVVHRVLDLELEREVALKTLRIHRVSAAATREFLHEASASARLQHPNIVPLHDVGTLADGRPFYTMKLITGRVLGQVLYEQATGLGTDVADWTLVRLVQVVQQICLALQYAHERGVLHRDVKPSNVCLGEFGEVLLVDWGIARSSHRRSETESGIIKGTVAYMAPEQARAGKLDSRMDIYAVGVLLYQVLTLRLPFDHESEADQLAAILRDTPLPPEEAAPDRHVPPELSALALRALAKKPGDRPQTARDMHDELQAFVEGVRDRERKLAAADQLLRLGRAVLAEHVGARAEAAKLLKEVEQLETVHPSWQPIAAKRPLLEARKALQDATHRAEERYVEATARFSDALAYLPDHAEAREALADMSWARYVEAERAGEADGAAARNYRSLAERYHDGRIELQLRGHGAIRLKVLPASADLVMHRFVEKDLVLVDGPGQWLGRGEIEIDDVEMGSYVIVARAEGHESVRYPICIERNATWTGSLQLPKLGEIPAGFVYIPGAEAWLGGDARATNSWPLHRVSIESFAIGRFPVTFAEYCEFLDALHETGAAAAHVPMIEEGRALCHREGGRYVPDISDENLARVHAEGGLEAVFRVPVHGVHANDARAYCRWSGPLLQRPVRLPLATEWEFVARGCGRRTYPWGDAFDASLCHIRDSVNGLPCLAPVGRAATDCSSHGVRDLAGTIQEMTGSLFFPDRPLVEVRGGSWSIGPVGARAAWRGACSETIRNNQLGFRVALDLSARTTGT